AEGLANLLGGAGGVGGNGEGVGAGRDLAARGVGPNVIA
ncbi:hypothetical protein LCGC14_2117140, partial [marine sediment metagenome]